MLENGKIKVFVNYNERIYDVNFFINSFPFLKKIYAFSQYYKLQMKDDIKKFYDGNEIEYVFKYFEALIVFKVSESQEKNSMIAKIVELDISYNETEKVYIIDAVLCTKVLKYDISGRMSFRFDKLIVTLGYYREMKKASNLVGLVGNYIDLSEGIYIHDVQLWNSFGMKEQKQKTIENLMNSGFLRLTKAGLVDEEMENVLKDELGKHLDGVISPKLINELVEL